MKNFIQIKKFIQIKNVCLQYNIRVEEIEMISIFIKFENLLF